MEYTDADDRAIENRMALDRELDALGALEERLRGLRLWRRASLLADGVKRAGEQVASIGERLENRAIIAFVGGTGTGKSTLVNAVCGADDVVQSGIDRPTTRVATAVSRSLGDAEALLSRFGDKIVAKQQGAMKVDGAVVVDAPDTDSEECRSYEDVLKTVLRMSDVLVCVFDAANPKRLDNMRVLADWVSAFPERHVALVLNRCDRFTDSELEEIREDFAGNLSKTWKGDFRVFMVSAKAKLRRPEWAQGEAPRSEVNEFDALVGYLNGIVGRNFVDARIARARMLRERVAAAVAREIGPAEEWKSLAADVAGFESNLGKGLVRAVASASGDSAGDAKLVFSGEVADRWWGPVGLYLGLCRRLRGAATAAGGFGPIALARGIGAFVSPEKSEERARVRMGLESTDIGWGLVRPLVVDEWPRIAGRLVKMGMAESVLDGERAVDASGFAMEVGAAWPGAFARAVSGEARRASGRFLQFLSNAPLLSLAGWLLYRLLGTYFCGVYLPGEFYAHSAAVALLLWLVPSWLVQWRVSAKSERLADAVQAEFLRECGSLRIALLPVKREVDELLALVD